MSEKPDAAPLTGIKIVDLTSVVVGPIATQILADHGAEVIKVESLKGDLVRQLNGKSVTPGMGAKFLHLNRNKRSIALNLKSATGFRALVKLIERADVMVWNVRPSSMARLKLGYDDVRAINPKIIYCGMFGFGQDGRYRNKSAYDSIIQGASGITSLLQRAGEPGARPRNVPIVVADKVVGLIAVQMIMMALYRRTQTGKGSAIEIPMFENFVKFVLEEHMYLRTFDPPLGGTGDPRLLDPHAGPTPTKDGHICLSGNTDAQAFALFDAIGKPELKTDPRFCSVAARFANVTDYYALRSEGLKQKTTAEWLEIFDRGDVPAMPFHTVESVMEDPHLADAGFFRWVDHPTEGRIRSMRLPNKWSFDWPKQWTPAPKLGQHSVEVLAELGFSETQIKQMVDDGTTTDGRLGKAK